MRWSLPAIALLLTSGAALAHPHQDAAQPDDDGDFWRDLLEPHAAEVASLVERASSLLDEATTIDAEASGDVDRRERRLARAQGMLDHARALSPEQPDVLRVLGLTLDAMGRTGEAIELLERAARLAPLERVHTEVADRLGVIALRRGRPDDALRWLRTAAASRGPGGWIAPVVHLAGALTARGELTAAIELLRDRQARPGTTPTPEELQAGLALAVAYDRDEQPGAAFAVLDRMQPAALNPPSPNFDGETVARPLRAMGFAPAEDEYYYLAMLDETGGHYLAARARWVSYASIPGVAWRRRALDHIAQIDARKLHR